MLEFRTETTKAADALGAPAALNKDRLSLTTRY